ncbi:MAG: hypothetical protein IKR74_04535 [Bacilli bacterium]|nr:hypothetical protein [Bacilli bacterium]
MKTKEQFSITYFLTRPFFFGIIYSQIFGLSETDSIISCLLGTIIGLFIIFLISKMDYSDKKFKTIQIFFYLFLFILAISSIETYASSFLLTKTPKIIIIIPAIMLVSYANQKDMSVIKKCAFIFAIISIFSTIIICLLLSNYLNIQNILPFFSHKPLNILKSAMIFGVMSASPNILLKDENIPLKNHLIFYLITTIINTTIAFLTLAILTPDVAKIYSYPEYMVLKRIRIFEFIENIENLSVLIWYFDYFFLLVYIFKKMQEIIKKRVIFFIIIIMTTLLTTFFIANDFYITIWIYKYSSIIISTFLILFISTLKHK